VKFEHFFSEDDKFQTLFDLAPDAMLVSNRNGKIHLANSQAEKIFGYSKVELIGLTIESLVPKRYRDIHVQHRESFMAAPRTRSMGKGPDLFAVRKDESEVPVEISLSPLVLNHELFTLCAVRDITERKKIYDELKLKTERLEILNSELESFSYSVSHDLRAPLRAIDGFSQILLEKYSNKIDERGISYLQKVRSGSQNMAQLIDHLLQLARIPRLNMTRQSIDLGIIARNILDEFIATEPHRSVKIEIDEGLVVYGDAELLRILMASLLQNAWKFTAKRSVAVIEIGKDNLQEDKHCFFVRDNGAGFEMSYADKLFKPFQRLHNVAEFPGTGIGLATVQRIVRRHGGEVWAEGVVGQGATVHFTLES
jgi:PAS domain S-box-containing protein